SMPSLRLRF
uniref:FMRFamide-like neuropeptide FLP5 n=1 Tax=Penaeus monodon TaxID=6687 RepID=FAR5_PENMO|nr:RecName: Full=FMRFamide-like neuropeptide FLP5; AltName: Full=SMPSLRLRF-amide [Penaeus monodon]